MPERIERILLRHFRGATGQTDLRLDPDKPVVVIYGENGAGKSTLIDAIDFVCNRAVGSLGDRSGANPRQHLAAVGHTPREMSVEITCGVRTWEGCLEGGEVRVDGLDSPPIALVLRRRRLLQLGEDKPGERYKVVQQFVDVAGVEQAEQELDKAARGARAADRNAAERRQKADQELEGLWQDHGRPGVPGRSAVQWARDLAAITRTNLVHERAHLETLLRCWQEAADALGRHEQAREERVCRERALAGVSHELSSGACGAASKDLVHFLRTTRNYLGAAGAVCSCPACEQPISPEVLRGRVEARLNALAHTLELVEQAERAARDLDRARAVEQASRAELINKGQALAVLLRSSCLDLVGSLSLPSGFYERLLASAGDAQEQLPYVHTLLDQFAHVRETLNARLERVRADLELYAAVAILLREIRTVQAEWERARMLHLRLDKALQLVRQERLGFTQQVLETTAVECNRLYSRIHPDEPLGQVQLRLERRASLDQKAQFGDINSVPPQAYYSESHLDTLSLCVFLAVAHHFTQGTAILLLDDVFASVDGAHLKRLTALFEEQGVCFDQVIITTHSRAWRNHLAATTPTNVQLIELAPWTLQHGVSVQQ
jgi:energy-coupling factor transporter ATP-binding protein EcfA2